MLLLVRMLCSTQIGDKQFTYKLYVLFISWIIDINISF